MSGLRDVIVDIVLFLSYVQYHPISIQRILYLNAPKQYARVIRRKAATIIVFIIIRDEGIVIDEIYSLSGLAEAAQSSGASNAGGRSPGYNSSLSHILSMFLFIPVLLPR